MKIGVFDSGIGGLAMVRAIEHALPDAEVIWASDREHVPYGDKQPDELVGYVVPILQNLVTKGCQVIVIACNTVTTTIIGKLRSVIPVPLVGMEPMVKPAAQMTKAGVIAVCATPATLASDRYAYLKQTYANKLTVIEPDCSQWAYMIEHNKINETVIEEVVNKVCDEGADIIVLGCTHYHWIENTLQQMARGRAQVVQPEQAVIAQLKRQIALVQKSSK